MRGISRPVTVSIRNRSEYAPRGRQRKMSRARTTAARTPIPIAMDGVSPFRPAIAMNAPSPGRWNSVPPAVKISLATRKNQPFVHERMEL